MPLNKMDEFTFQHSKQQDDLYKVLSAQQIKEAFDSRGEELKTKLNQLITDLESEAAASNIGVVSIDGSPNNLQDVLVWLKNQLNQATIGQIPDYSITQQKLAFSPTTKTELIAHKNDYVKHPAFITAEGTANAITATIDDLSSYVDGMGIVVKIATQNTGATTINLNGLGAKNIRKGNGNTLPWGGLKAGSLYTLRYNASTDFFILQGEGGSGNALASDLLSGKTASTDAGDIVGTMPNYGSPTLLMSSASGVAIPPGYYSGGTARLSVTPGTFVVFEYNGTVYSNSSKWFKSKEVRINIEGTYAVTFDLSHNNTGAYPLTVSGELRKNGNSIGTTFSATLSGSGTGYSPGYSGNTQNLFFEAGSICSLWLSVPRGYEGSSFKVSSNIFRFSAGLPPFMTVTPQ